MGLDESPGKEIGSRREGVGNKGLEKKLWGNPEIKENKIPINFTARNPDEEKIKMASGFTHLQENLHEHIWFRFKIKRTRRAEIDLV